MGSRDELYRELAKANRKIAALEKALAEDKVIYRRDTERMIESLRDKSELLTNVSRGNLRIGGLQQADADRYLNILKRFNANEMSTVSGQRNILKRTKQSFEESFSTTGKGKSKKVMPIPDEYYETMVRIFESDQFQRFKEKYGTYSNAIAAMVMDQKFYIKALGFLEEVVNDNTGKYLEKGTENISAKKFLTGWKQFGESSKRRKKKK